MTTIDLVYFDAGGGHRAAALALRAVIAEQRRPWTVRLVNLFDALDPQSLFRKLTGFAPEDFYNRRLKRGWTLGLAQELKLLQAAIRIGHAAMVRQLGAHWSQTRPDLVVSLVPNFNRALYQGLRSAAARTPFVTVLTDFADLPPHFWIEPGQDQHLVCGTPRAVAQAYEAGYGRGRVHAASGMILRPDFHRAVVADREAERRALGFDARAPLGLVLFGGHGSTVMRGIARALHDRPLVLVCGHNAALAQALRALPAGAPRLVVGYTDEVPRLMQLADYLIGKPGPGCLSEAMQSGLPVIVTRNAFTMPQERYNTDWVREQEVGLVIPRFAAVRDAVDALTAELPRYRANVARQRNRAVFEVPAILARILEERAGASPECRRVVTLAT